MKGGCRWSTDDSSICELVTTVGCERHASRARSAATWTRCAPRSTREIIERRRAECLAKIQTDVVKLAVDLLVREPDIDGFFRALLKTLAEEGESHKVGVWLIDEDQKGCDVWMAHLDGAGLHRRQSRVEDDGVPASDLCASSVFVRAGLAPDGRVQHRRRADARQPCATSSVGGAQRDAGRAAPDQRQEPGVDHALHARDARLQ